MAANLTIKQEAFFQAYIETGNASGAAKVAGIEFEEVGSGYYVYFLVDPTNGQIFYVGKGTKDRVRSHVRQARLGNVDNAEKYKRICSVHATGREVEEVIFSNHAKESDAYIAERELIKRFADTGLSNISGGIMTNEELAQQKAKAGLARMKTLDEWMATATDAQKSAALNIWGSFKACYDAIVAEYEYFASGRFKEIT